MQQDLFVEKIVKRKRRGVEVALIIMLILSAILLILISFFIPILMQQQSLLYISTFAAFGIGYLAYRLITGLSREYEYSITNDELTIDLIIAQRKRKNVFKGSCKDFAVFAPESKLSSDTFTQKNLLHLDVRSGEDHGCDWYFITKSNPPTLVLFEPDDRFIAVVKRFNPRALLNTNI